MKWHKTFSFSNVIAGFLINMDQSEPEEVRPTNTNSQKVVSRVLIDLLIEKKGRLQDYLEIIKKDLLFEDPGLLAKTIIYDEEERHVQDTTIWWLINQLIHNVNLYKTM